MKFFKRLGKNRTSFDGHATMEDVTAAYRLFLKRMPDPEGYRQYQQLVANGLSLDRLISIFTTSSEYKALMARESAIIAVNLGGYSVCVRQSETDFGAGIIATKDYEPHVRKAIRDLLKEGQTFVDVGANVGCISFLAAQIVGPKGAVISIEPNPDNLQLLYAGIVLNGLQNIRVLPYAASDRSGVFSLIGGTSNTHLVPASNYTAAEFYAQSVVLDKNWLTWQRLTS